MNEAPAAGPGERLARITLLLLTGFILAGLAAWLHRVYGFEPLKVTEPEAPGSRR